MDFSAIMVYIVGFCWIFEAPGQDRTAGSGLGWGAAGQEKEEEGGLGHFGNMV